MENHKVLAAVGDPEMCFSENSGLHELCEAFCASGAVCFLT